MKLAAIFPRASRSFLDANQHLWNPAAMPPPVNSQHVQDLSENMSEAKLQQACEQWLESVGYVRMTAANAVRDVPWPRGWYGHLFNPKGNPFLPDLLILDSDCKAALCVELKTREDYRPGQRQMIDRGQWRLARSMAEFCEIVKQWENRKETTNEN